MGRIGRLVFEVEVDTADAAAVARSLEVTRTAAAGVAIVRVGGRRVAVSEPVGPADLSRVGSLLLAAAKEGVR